MLVRTNQDSTRAVEISSSPEKTFLFLIDELEVIAFGPETYRDPSLGE